MDRTIKFRVWFAKEKRWLHGPHQCEKHGLSCKDLDGVHLFGETILFGELLNGVSIEDLNECRALQFTGLQDKNSKEIFEGDILESLGEVVFKFGCFGVHIDYDCHWFPFSEMVLSDLKVIGNIFDNPELLKP